MTDAKQIKNIFKNENIDERKKEFTKLIAKIINIHQRK